jgi:hypothetical protein
MSTKQQATALASYRARAAKGEVVSDGDGRSRWTADAMSDFAVAVGSVAAAGRDAFCDWARRDFASARAALWGSVVAARATTPATPGSGGSGRPVAAAAPVPAPTPSGGTAHPAEWKVDATLRPSGVRVESHAAAAPAPRASGGVVAAEAMPAYVASQQAAALTAVTEAQARRFGYDDKAVKPSSFAADAEAARIADQQRMAAEQTARYGA